MRVSLHSVDNALSALTLVVLVRYGLRHWAPFVGVWRLSGGAIDAWCARTVERAQTRAPRVSHLSGARITLVLAAFAFAVKAWFAVTWDLRSPIFPFACVFPVQWTAYALGISEVGSLVIAGRLAIAVLSTLAVWLTWRIGEQLWSEERAYALLAAALVATAKLQIAFGSSELPRPVSTVLILSAFLLLQRRSTSSSASQAR